MEAAFVLIGLAVAFGTFVLVVVLPVATFLRCSRALREAQRANERIDALARVIQGMLRERRVEGAPETPAAEPVTGEAAPTAAVPVPEPVARPEAPVPTVAAAAAPAAPIVAVPSETGAVEAPGGLPSPVAPPAEPALPVALSPVGDAGTTAAAPPVPPPPAGPPPSSVAPAARVRAESHHAHVTEHPSLEQRIGQRWLLYAGIAAIVLGASYIVKLAFDNNWITPAMRVALSALGGGVLVVVGLRFASGGLRFFGYALSGGGFAVVYVAIYAAQHLYGLIDRGPSFWAMAAVTATAAGLADRRSAQPIAMAALIGGFATPFLVGGDASAYVTLFSYVSLLVAGAAFLARRHAWPLLTLAAFTLTAFTFSAWSVTSYRGDRYLVVQGFLTLWLALFIAAVAWPAAGDGDEQRRGGASSDALSSGVAVVVGVLAPALYHLASLANLAGHSRDLLIYFIAATLAGILYSADGKRPWARLLTWVAVWLPMIGWLLERSPAGARVTVVAIFGLHLMNEVRVFLRDRDRLDLADGLLLHLNGLGLVAALLALHARWDTDAMSATVAGVGVFYGLLGLFMRRRHDAAPLHYLALASACAAGAIALRFEGAWVTVGWAVEGALLCWLGLRERRQWMRLGGWLLLLLGLAHGLEHMAQPASVATRPWLNAPALSLALVAGLLLWLAGRYGAEESDTSANTELPIGVAVILASLTGLVLVTEQINGMFGRFAWQREVTEGPMAAGAADLARQVTLSIVWASYAVGLLVAGIARRYALARYLAILLFAATIGKVFFVDLAQLDRIYRIFSVIGLGLLLVLASYLYQRFMSDDGSANAPDRPGPPG